MNKNNIITTDFSNSDSKALYKNNWPDDLKTRALYDKAVQCGGCSFFAGLNKDWGICCNSKSKYYLETIFEHFTCLSHINEGWGPHSFSEDEEDHCKCIR